MAATRSDTLWNTPRRIRFVGISRNQRSTRFNHDALVGVKCKIKRGWVANTTLSG